jgi:hypothetical protein
VFSLYVKSFAKQCVKDSLNGVMQFVSNWSSQASDNLTVGTRDRMCTKPFPQIRDAAQQEEEEEHADSI